MSTSISSRVKRGLELELEADKTVATDEEISPMVDSPSKSSSRPTSLFLPSQTKWMIGIVAVFAFFVLLNVVSLGGGKGMIHEKLPPKYKREIKTIALIGERNSGTTWAYKELQRCFNQTFEVRNDLTRHKHYFQYDDGKPHNQTLVISAFRHPYYWILGMMAKSRHTPAHRNLDWHAYVTTPWTTDREASDLVYKNSTERVCKEKFSYHEVVCCEFDPPEDEYIVTKRDGRQEQETPFYELRKDGSGIPYGSVLDMRADKIRNHVLEIKEFDFVTDVLVVRYEDLLEKGTSKIIREVERITKKKAHCKPTPPQPTRKKREILKEFKEWMDLHADWEGTEKLIGYERWPDDYM